ncbi:hypothetical protein BRADI_5g02218v3 [Brachypodium distachyon]|uniref:Uncharacterized protein n=1 Tax=Brachypodium distachyon TaxID=15368 RepID=A0A0Q3E1Z7_BRADI|nr:hypothetical protein BRADI_5g02218v3 [Brachypodium distachyon]
MTWHPSFSAPPSQLLLSLPTSSLPLQPPLPSLCPDLSSLTPPPSLLPHPPRLSSPSSPSLLPQPATNGLSLPSPEPLLSFEHRPPTKAAGPRSGSPSPGSGGSGRLRPLPSPLSISPSLGSLLVLTLLFLSLPFLQTGRAPLWTARDAMEDPAPVVPCAASSGLTWGRRRTR